MNFLKLQNQVSNQIERNQPLIRYVYLDDMKEISDIYLNSKNTGDRIFDEDFGIPVRLVEIEQRIAAVLSLVVCNEEIRGIIRLQKEFRDTGIEYLLVDEVSRKTPSEAILINNMLICRISGHEDMGTIFGFNELPVFHRSLSRLTKWLNS